MRPELCAESRLLAHSAGFKSCSEALALWLFSFQN